MSDLGRVLVVAGIGLAMIGGILLLLERLPGLPLGRLPGDFSWESGDTRFYFPLATMIIVSVVLTLLVNLVLRLFK